MALLVLTAVGVEEALVELLVAPLVVLLAVLAGALVEAVAALRTHQGLLIVD
jgi:hypothetical protein